MSNSNAFPPPQWMGLYEHHESIALGLHIHLFELGLQYFYQGEGNPIKAGRLRRFVVSSSQVGTFHLIWDI